MRLRRVAVVGGGPAGLYAARLLKLHNSSLEVTVHERNHPAETFGFGVALTNATQGKLAAADEESYRAIMAAGVPIEAQEFRLPGSRAEIRAPRSLGIGRSVLLRVLLEQAERIGVTLELGDRQATELDADVILACDGVNSATRAALGAQLGERVETGRGLYIWCGTDIALPHQLFIPVTTEHGTFVAHAYPYAGDRSTVLIETDQESWRRARFDATTAALEETSSAASDETSLAYLREAFSTHLEGHRLLGNRSRWLSFRTVTCERWHHGRTVLLGDAAHTAHYSLGSGTKLAMEDAIALSEVLSGADDASAAFSAYEAARRPAVARLQQLARRSQRWWESFASRAFLPAETIAIAFMTRAGNVSLERFQGTNGELLARGLACLDGAPPSDLDDPTTWVLERPLEWEGRRFPNRFVGDDPGIAELRVQSPDCWGPQGDAVVGRTRTLIAGGPHGVRLSGAEDREALLDRLALGERLRLETGALVVVEGSVEHRGDLAAGLASRRADLVAMKPVATLNAVGRIEWPLDRSRPAPRQAPTVRIGLIVPSSNVTVESELAALLGRHPDVRFTLHSSRMRMDTVSDEGLRAMNAQRERCVDEVADAGVDAVLYGCLVAIMAQGPGEHRAVEAAISEQLLRRVRSARVVSSAGALVEALRDLSARRIVLVSPYKRPLARRVVEYLESEGLSVVDWIALDEADNRAVARIEGTRVMAAARGLDRSRADALVVSACVQMPSLDLIQPAEEEFGIPVLSAATAGAHVLLQRLGIGGELRGAGSLLSAARCVASLPQGHRQ